MLYDPQGRPIDEPEAKPPQVGIWCSASQSDLGDTDASRNLTPAKVDQYMTAANSGDITDLVKLAAELEEKNPDIAHALQTRRLAVLGCPLSVTPGDKSAKAKEIAAAFELALNNAGRRASLDTTANLVADLLGALLPGFAASEIVWGKGGELLGFKHIEQRHFNYRDGKLLLIPQDQSAGVEMPAAKLVFRRARVRSGLLCRDGLVRPLAWLHCFANLNLKDLLGFIERYGMPFLTAKVDEKSWNNDRAKIQALIRGLGPSGGGVFTRAVELELLQASNNTGDVYFKLLEYVRLAIEKLILGQTATSGPSGGLSKGDAQSAVRQDILEADCAAVADTINSQVATPWTLFNYGPGAPVPVVGFECAPPEDLQAFATIVKTLSDAGFEADEAEMSERFGLKLKRKAPPPPPPEFNAKDANGAKGASGQDLEPGTRNQEPAEGDAAALAADSGSGTGVPPVDSEDALVTAALEAFARDGADKWAGKLLSGFQTEALAKTIENTVYAAAAGGAASKATELNSKGGKGS